MKEVVILGSTGTIGVNTLKVIEKEKNKFKVVALACKQNKKLLSSQIEKFNPEFVYIEEKDTSLERRFKNVKFFHKGQLAELSKIQADIFIFAIPGIESLTTFVECVKRGKTIGLATKEILVVAGEIVNKLIKKYKSKVLPIDSEHNAIFQIIRKEKKKHIRKIYITASGGPFYGKKIKNPSLKQVLSHPVWKMGKKITVDSATMMNKCFEIIEAHYLFSLPVEKIGVLIHPEAIIHGMVEFIDGSIKAVLYKPDMKIPISYVLNYPEREQTSFDYLDFKKTQNLTLQIPSEDEDFIKLAKNAIKTKGSYPVVLNASNDLAVELFLQKKIKFHDIIPFIKKTLEKHKVKKKISLNEIFTITEQIKNTSVKRKD